MAKRMRRSKANALALSLPLLLILFTPTHAQTDWLQWGGPTRSPDNHGGGLELSSFSLRVLRVLSVSAVIIVTLEFTAETQSSQRWRRESRRSGGKT